MKTLQSFFDSSLPNIKHPEVKQWGEDLEDDVYQISELQEFESGLSRPSQHQPSMFFASSGSDARSQPPRVDAASRFDASPFETTQIANKNCETSANPLKICTKSFDMIANGARSRCRRIACVGIGQ